MNKNNPPKDDLVTAIVELASKGNQLARHAEQLYTVEVEAILRERCRDPQRIEHTLDGILDFCFDPALLGLYKKLCCYYFKIDPEATASYIYLYREMWDEEVSEN
jgi:hypothetical protein